MQGQHGPRKTSLVILTVTQSVRYDKTILVGKGTRRRRRGGMGCPRSPTIHRTIPPLAAGTYSVRLAATDLAGNFNRITGTLQLTGGKRRSGTSGATSSH